jgi:hypothetical protein
MGFNNNERKSRHDLAAHNYHYLGNFADRQQLAFGSLLYMDGHAFLALKKEHTRWEAT